MQDLITTFHIDWMMMLAQIVNFGLVFACLYLIAAKPLSKLIKDRNEEITTGLDNAKKAEAEVANANIKREEIIKTAKDDAKKVLASSQADGKEIIKEAKDKATVEKEEIIRQAKLDAEKAKKGADEAVRTEAAGLVTEGIKKIVEGYVSAGKGEDLIKGMLHK